MPTEEELARIAGLVPGIVEQKKLLEVQQSLNEKGSWSLRPRTYSLGPHRLLVVDDLRPCCCAVEMST